MIPGVQADSNNPIIAYISLIMIIIHNTVLMDKRLTIIDACLEPSVSVCDGQTFKYMMTSSNGNIFWITGYLCGEFIGNWWIPLAKASHAELWSVFFFLSAPGLTVE